MSNQYLFSSPVIQEAIGSYFTCENLCVIFSLKILRRSQHLSGLINEATTKTCKEGIWVNYQPAKGLRWFNTSKEETSVMLLGNNVPPPAASNISSFASACRVGAHKEKSPRLKKRKNIRLIDWRVQWLVGKLRTVLITQRELSWESDVTPSEDKMVTQRQKYLENGKVLL